MRKNLYLIICIIGIMFLSSCDKKQMSIITNRNVEYINVPINTMYSGAHVIPTKGSSESNDLWGIQIYKVDNPNFPEPYFCALYDDISLLTSVRFVKGGKYSINANYMPNGKLYNSNYGQYPGGFFECAPNSSGISVNKEYYSNDTYYGSITRGVCTQFRIFTYEYYMFQNNEFVVDETLEKLEIDFQRANCGIVLNFECEDGFKCNEVIVNINGFEGRALNEQRVQLTNGIGSLSIPSITIDNYMWMGENVFNLKIGTTENKYFFYDGNVKLQANKVRSFKVKLFSINDTDAGIRVTYSNIGELDVEDMGILN